MNKFVQIGAGASDLDKNYEDGFANFIKKKSRIWNTCCWSKFYTYWKTKTKLGKK